MNKNETRIEYDRFYRRKPQKWTSDERNEYARKQIEEYLEGDLPKSFLDVGCGNGHTIKYLSQYWTNTKFYGFDLSPVAIETAKTAVPDAHFQTSFLDEASYSMQFHVVALLGVIEHIEDIQAGLAHIKSLMAKNGIVYIEAPNCLAYEGSTPEESYRRVNFGNRQMEWHLKRATWINHFERAGMKVAASIYGTTPQTEFIFILER